MKIVMTTAPTSTNNKTTMMKKLKEDGFWFFNFSSVRVLFCDVSFFFTFLSSSKSFLSPRI